MKNIGIWVGLLFVGLIQGCGSRTTTGADGDRVEIERFDRVEASYCGTDSAVRDSVIGRFEPAIDFMSAVSGIADRDSVMTILCQSQAVIVFQPDIEQRLADLASVERELGGVKSRMNAGSGKMRFPARVFGFVMPYEQSVVLVDSIVMIGLNHYLGADYEGYAGFDDYKRRLKESSRIVYDVTEAIVRSNYPYKVAGHGTVASRLAYEGAIAKMVESLIDGSRGADVLGYDDEAYNRASEHEGELWSRMVSDKMLYSIDQTVAERLVAPAPFSIVGEQRAPGRIGRFLGYKMVDSYLKKMPDVSAEDILSGELYGGQEFVVESGYVGRK